MKAAASSTIKPRFECGAVAVHSARVPFAIEEKANTKIEYLYRDAENYKKWEDVVVRGHFSMNDISEFLHEHEYFIPSVVGLRDLQEEPFHHYDHVWHEIWKIYPTDDRPTTGIRSEQLIQSFRDASKSDWNFCGVLEQKDLM